MPCKLLALGFENHIDDMSLHDGREGLDWEQGSWVWGNGYPLAGRDILGCD